MIKWYKNLTVSEQRLLKLGSMLLAVVFFWVLVYQPLTKKINSQAEVKNRLQQQLTEMRNIQPQLLSSGAAQQSVFPPNTTFSSWVDRQLSQIGLQELVNRTEPLDSNTLTVWLNNAPFDTLVDWLQSVQLQYGVVVDQIDVNVTDKDLGLTNIRMRLVKQ